MPICKELPMGSFDTRFREDRFGNFYFSFDFHGLHYLIGNILSDEYSESHWPISYYAQDDLIIYYLTFFSAIVCIVSSSSCISVYFCRGKSQFEQFLRSNRHTLLRVLIWLYIYVYLNLMFILDRCLLLQKIL